MNKIEFNNLLKPLISIYDEIELDLIKNIISRIDNYDDIKGNLKWYLDKLNEVNLLDDENKLIINKNKSDIKKTLKNMVESTGKHIDNFNLLNDYYNKELIKVNPLKLSSNNAINNLIREALKDSNDIMNLINTKAIEGAQESYKNILNKAYVETASGVYPYTESIRRALNDFAKEGIRAVHYDSGRTLSIEAVVRRDVITRVNKLVGDCEIEHAKELGTNLVYVDQHLGARVRTKYMKNDYEAHVEWQGKKYMIDGSSNKYPNLYEATGYGEMLGLKGLNCYHNLRPTWEWEKIPDVIDEVQNVKEYEKLQKQRSFERKTRELKRHKIIAQSINDKTELKSINKKLKLQNDKYNNWLKENNLTRDFNREFISNKINQIVFEEEYFTDFKNLDISKEHLIYYNLETGKMVGNIVTGSNNKVQPDIKTKTQLLFAKSDSLMAVHNHPRNTSFSLTDMITFNNSKELGAIAVRTDNYIYVLSTGKSIKSKNIDLMTNKYNSIKIKVKKENLNIIEERHKINTIFAKEMGWKYGRIKNKKED